MFQTKFSTSDSKSFYNYYKDIAKRIKDREKDTAKDKDRIDILLVVNMYLTGFDAKKVSTLYVDKNLKYHGLIQAFSRTNRILNDVKSQGNIVCFRPLKKNTDEAIALFSNEDAKETVLMEPYEEYIVRFNDGVKLLKSIVPEIQSVDSLASEEDKLKFIKAFRYLMRTKNEIESFSEFSFNDLHLTPQEFEDYKSKYLDLYKESKSAGDIDAKASILHDVDFELELIARDEINVAYIINLLAQMYGKTEPQEAKKKKEDILKLLASEASLHSKKELIERFINQYMPNIKNSDDISEEFKKYWNQEKQQALEKLCEEEELNKDELNKVIKNYMYSGKTPLIDNIIAARTKQPSVLHRKTIAERIIERIKKIVNIFEDNIGNI